MTDDKKFQIADKVSPLACYSMIGASAAIFAIHFYYKEWSAASAWFCAGMAWALIELKERTIRELFTCNRNIVAIAAYQHELLLKHGIIHEEASEKEDVATP